MDLNSQVSIAVMPDPLRVLVSRSRLLMSSLNSPRPQKLLQFGQVEQFWQKEGKLLESKMGGALGFKKKASVEAPKTCILSFGQQDAKKNKKMPEM